MTRLYELIFMLVFIILLSTFASSLKREGFANVDINKISDDVAASGMNAIACSPSSPVKSFIRLVPTLDDLLSSNYLKPEYTYGLGGLNTITSRSCTEPSQGTSLMASIDSNKHDCGMLIDLQPYSLIAVALGRLRVYVDSTRGVLKVVPNKTLIDMLLYRPIFLTFDNSKPYMLDMTSKNPFLFSTFSLPNVQGYNSMNSTKFELPIKEISRTGTNLFPLQNTDVVDIIKRKTENIKKVTNDSQIQIVELDVVLYYAKIKETFGNKVSIPQDSSMAYITSDNKDNQGSYIQNMISMVKFPKDPINPIITKNPVFSIKFSIFVGSQPDSNKQPWWMDKWVSVLKVGDDGWENCNLQGRGLSLVEMRPASMRNSSEWNFPFKENGSINPKYICLDFTNTEVDSASGNLVDACGGANRAYLYIPTGVPVDIAFIIGPSMKVATASYYDHETKKRHMVVSNTYHNGSKINSVLTALRTIPNLTIQNMFARKKLDPSQFQLRNIDFSYGMLDLHEWFYSLN